MSKANELLMGAKESVAKRPVGITVLAILYMIPGFARLLMGLVGTWKALFTVSIPHVPHEPMWFNLMPQALGCALGAIYMVIGIGLWKLRRWARGVFIIWMTLGLVVATLGLIVMAILQLVNQVSLDLPMATIWLLLICVFAPLCLWYMYLPHVKRAFGVLTPSSAPSTQAVSPSGPAPA